MKIECSSRVKVCTDFTCFGVPSSSLRVFDSFIVQLHLVWALLTLMYTCNDLMSVNLIHVLVYLVSSTKQKNKK